MAAGRRARSAVRRCAVVVAVPHGYTDVEAITADVEAGGLACRSIETVTLEGEAASAGDIALGFCTGTPVRAAIEARGDLEESTRRVAAEMESIAGPAPFVGTMNAYLVEAADIG